MNHRLFKTVLTAFVLSIALTSVEKSKASLLCSEIYRSQNETALNEATVVAIRSAQLFKTEARLRREMKLNIGGMYQIGADFYNIIGLLGQATNRVVLARNSLGIKVVIKVPNPKVKEIYREDAHLLQLNEVRLTEYLLSEGQVLPRILNYDFVSSNFIIKEYFEGLTLAELQKNQRKLRIDDEKMEKLVTSLEDVATVYFKRIRPGYLKWLKQKYPQEFKLLKDIESASAVNDSMRIDSNFVFHIGLQRWVILDP